MRKLGLAALVAATLAGGGLLSTAFNGQPARADMQGYKVIEMSADEAEAADLEKMLNEQVVGGWRLHSQVDDRLFIFERR
jgi:hypothetical protein